MSEIRGGPATYTPAVSTPVAAAAGATMRTVTFAAATRSSHPTAPARTFHTRTSSIWPTKPCSVDCRLPMRKSLALPSVSPIVAAPVLPVCTSTPLAKVLTVPASNTTAMCVQVSSGAT